MGRIVGWMRGTHDLGRGRDRRAVELWKEGGEKKEGNSREREMERRRDRGREGERREEGKEGSEQGKRRGERRGE